jgi:hypothetical protein
MVEILQSRKNAVFKFDKNVYRMERFALGENLLDPEERLYFTM